MTPKKPDPQVGQKWEIVGARIQVEITKVSRTKQQITGIMTSVGCALYRRVKWPTIHLHRSFDLSTV